MRGGAFEKVDFIDGSIVDIVLEEYEKDPRNLFMVNLLSYEQELISGLKPRHPIPEIDDKKFLQVKQSLFNKILYDIQGSK